MHDTLRKIIHIDMDAFYASVEQRDRPELRGKPVIVGGNPYRRGVVAACSYEARRFGIHSAMSGRAAMNRCPHAVFIPPRFDVYREVSGRIRSIFAEYADRVEPLSLDEAFLDVTENKKGIPYAYRVAREIRCRIRSDTGLTASAGVSFNKFLAKVASDENKPNGITVVTPEDAAEFIDRLPIRKFFGVGRATEEKMRRIGVRTGRDLKRFAKADLVRIFGKAGSYFHDIAHGLDRRPVISERRRKSLGKETTLVHDIDDRPRMLEILDDIARRLIDKVRKEAIRAFTLTLKVKYADFQIVTRSLTRSYPYLTVEGVMRDVRDLLRNTEAGPRKVRLLGITVSNFLDAGEERTRLQLVLPFEENQSIPQY